MVTTDTTSQGGTGGAFRDSAGGVSGRLVQCIGEHLESAAGGAARTSWCQRTAATAGDPMGWLPANTFADLLREAASTLNDPEAPEAIGRTAPVALGAAEIGSLVGGITDVPSLFRELPNLFATLDRSVEVSLEDTGRRRFRVRLRSATPIRPELAAFRRGFVAALPGFVRAPTAVVTTVPETDPRNQTLDVRWRVPVAFLRPIVGLVLGAGLGAGLAFSGILEDPAIFGVPLRLVLTVALATLGMLVGSQGVGLLRALGFGRPERERYAFLREQVAALRASHAELEETRRQLHEQVARRSADLEEERERLRKLLSLSHELNAVLDLGRLLHTAVRRVPALLGARACSVFLLDREQSALQLIAQEEVATDGPTGRGEPATADAAPEGEDYPTIRDHVMREAIDRNRSFFIRDVRRDLGRVPGPDNPQGGMMAILLRSGELTLGVLNVAGTRDGQPFEEGQYRLAVAIGQHLATAISNASLLRRTQLLSVTDGLTGLYLHRFFQEVLEREIDRVRRFHQPLTVLMMDVDGFKRFNDRYGHPIGDQVLKAVTRIIREELRSTDIPARYGGDEFSAILIQTTAEGGFVLAERIRKKVAMLQVSYGDQRLSVTVSIGVCQYRASMTRAKLIEYADQAMYRAKTRGRNRVELHWEDQFHDRDNPDMNLVLEVDAPPSEPSPER